MNLIEQLREYASNNGYSHGDYADTMRQAADRIAELESRPAAPVALPPVYYSRDHDNFYDRITGKGMGEGFYLQWRVRKGEFPIEPTDHKAPAAPVVAEGLADAVEMLNLCATWIEGITPEQLELWREAKVAEIRRTLRKLPAHPVAGAVADVDLHPVTGNPMRFDKLPAAPVPASEAANVLQTLTDAADTFLNGGVSGLRKAIDDARQFLAAPAAPTKDID